MFEVWIWEKNKVGPRKVAEFFVKTAAEVWCEKMLDMKVVSDYAISEVECFVYKGGL